MSCEGGQCRWDDETSVTLCEVHWTALTLQSFNHRGFCQECCDLHPLMKELEAYGLDTVKHSFRHMRRGQAKYWRGILRILETGELSA